MAGDRVILSGRYVSKFFPNGDQGRVAEGDEEGQNAGKGHTSHTQCKADFPLISTLS